MVSEPHISDAALIRQVREETETLLRVCATINEPRPVDEALNTILLEARRLVGAEAGSLYVLDGATLRFVGCQNDAMGLEVAALRPDQPGTPALLASQRVRVDDRTLTGYVAATGRLLNIDDVYAIASDQPYRHDATWDRATGYRCHSMLVVPMHDRDGRVVGVLQLINRTVGGAAVPFGPHQERLIDSLANVAAVTLKNAQLNDELQRSHLDTVLRLSTAAEFRDWDTGEHIRRMSCYCELIARAMGLSRQQATRMLFASPMHDVGKLGIPDAILQKPGPLSDAEWAIMQRHTVIGAEILGEPDHDILACARQIALGHHERWDGTGYPQGTRGEAIPMSARIAAVADVFDAMTSDRCYQPAMPPEQAVKRIAALAGRHFDPAVAEAFLGATDDALAIREAYPPGAASARIADAPSGGTVLQPGG